MASRGPPAGGEIALPSNQFAQPPQLSAVDDDWSGKARARIVLAAKNPHRRYAAVPLPHLSAVQGGVISGAFGAGGVFGSRGG
jgi:hypothetical protein